MLQPPHVLNMDEAGGQNLASAEAPSAEAIFEKYGEAIIDEIEARLVDQEDAIFFNGKWFLKSLFIDVNVGHLHLAEPILDINRGGAPPTHPRAQEIAPTQRAHQT